MVLLRNSCSREDDNAWWSGAPVVMAADLVAPAISIEAPQEDAPLDTIQTFICLSAVRCRFVDGGGLWGGRRDWEKMVFDLFVDTVWDRWVLF